MTRAQLKVNLLSLFYWQRERENPFYSYLIIEISIQTKLSFVVNFVFTDKTFVSRHFLSRHLRLGGTIIIVLTVWTIFHIFNTVKFSSLMAVFLCLEYENKHLTTIYLRMTEESFRSAPEAAWVGVFQFRLPGGW